MRTIISVAALRRLIAAERQRPGCARGADGTIRREGGALKALVGAAVLISVVAVPALAAPNPEGLEYSAQPDAILRQIAARGAAPVVKELYGHSADWGKVLAAIKAGDDAWLNVAVALRPGTDAGSSSMLSEAVGLALIGAPLGVLRIAIPTFSVDTICGGRQDPLPTYAAAQAELEAQIKSVASITDQAAFASRTECLEKLKRARESTKRFFGVK